MQNPKTGHYVKIDREKGRIISHKKSEGPYKGVPVATIGDPHTDPPPSFSLRLRAYHTINDY